MTYETVDHIGTDASGLGHKKEPKDGEVELITGKDDDERNEYGAEENKRIGNNIHSRIEALKETVKREKAKDKIRIRSENREVKQKSKNSAPRIHSPTLAALEAEMLHVLDPQFYEGDRLVPDPTTSREDQDELLRERNRYEPAEDALYTDEEPDRYSLL
jgi:hypothetical protein